MTLRAGGFAWLLRHELRLALRGTGARRSWLARTLPLILLATVPALAGVALAVALAHIGGARLPARVDAMLTGVASAVVAGLLLLMVATAMIAALRTFYDRGDLDLLLSAPVPRARVLAAKAVGVAVTVAAPFMLIVVPFALASALLGSPARLALVVMIAVLATLATAVALTVTSALIAAVGARRARVVAQLAAAAVGGLAFLVSQAPNLAPGLAGRAAATLGHRWPAPLDWPGRAALGEPGPLAAMVALAVAAAWAAARLGARNLGTREASVRTTARTTRPRFATGLTRVVVAKELRLLVRDPELITQVALRLIYLIPLGALVLRGAGDGAGVAGGVTAAAGLLAASLAWIVVLAEDAPDLLAAAPVAARRVARAKLIAACIVPVAVVAAAAVALAVSTPWAAVVTLIGGTGAAVTAALLQAWFGRPAPRSAFRRRQQGSFVIGVGEIVLAAAWAGTATLLARGSVAAIAPGLVVATIMAGAIEARRARREPGA